MVFIVFLSSKCPKSELQRRRDQGGKELGSERNSQIPLHSREGTSLELIRCMFCPSKISETSKYFSSSCLHVKQTHQIPTGFGEEEAPAKPSLRNTYFDWCSEHLKLNEIWWATETKAKIASYFVSYLGCHMNCSLAVLFCVRMWLLTG